MDSSGSILIVDDDDTFRVSTSRLLEQAGFDCHGVRDADQAVDQLRQQRFDLLVSDIRMPHSPKLRVVREAGKLDDRMPVILVTGYPSMDTAVQSVALSVVAYLTKPLDFDELLEHVRAAVQCSRQQRTIATVVERLRSILEDLETASPVPSPQMGSGAAMVPRETFRTLASCLSQLLDIAERSGAAPGSHGLCELLDCRQQPVYRQAILETIRVLKATKQTFKSKALAQLRAELEKLV